MGHLPDIRPCIEGDCSILKDIRAGYALDPLCSKVLENIGHHRSFEIFDGLLYTRNRAGASVLCIPSAVVNRRRLTEVIIAQAHEVLGHFGPQKSRKPRTMSATTIGGPALGKTLSGTARLVQSAR